MNILRSIANFYRWNGTLRGRISGARTGALQCYCCLLKGGVEPSQTHADCYDSHPNQDRDVGDHELGAAAFQHNIAKKAHVVRERVDQSKPPN